MFDSDLSLGCCCYFVLVNGPKGSTVKGKEVALNYPHVSLSHKPCNDAGQHLVTSCIILILICSGGVHLGVAPATRQTCNGRKSKPAEF